MIGIAMSFSATETNLYVYKFVQQILYAVQQELAYNFQIWYAYKFVQQELAYNFQIWHA